MTLGRIRPTFSPSFRSASTASFAVSAAEFRMKSAASASSIRYRFDQVVAAAGERLVLGEDLLDHVVGAHDRVGLLLLVVDLVRVVHVRPDGDRLLRVDRRHRGDERPEEVAHHLVVREDLHAALLVGGEEAVEGDEHREADRHLLADLRGHHVHVVDRLGVRRHQDDPAGVHRQHDVAVVAPDVEGAGHRAIGLFALIALPLPFLRSMGYGGMLIPLVSTLVAITLFARHPVEGGRPARLAAQAHRRQGQPRLGPLGAGRLAAALARCRCRARRDPGPDLCRNQHPARQLGRRHDRQARRRQAGADVPALEDAGIGEGSILPHEILVQGGASPDKVAADLRGVDGIPSAVAPQDGWRREGTAIVEAIPVPDSGTSEGGATLEAVRDTAHAAGPDVRVGGGPAANDDFIDSVYGSFPLTIPLIAITTFILLARAFRSLVLPLKAIILNILSVAAAWGVLVLVWQEGYGSEAIWNIQATGSLPSSIPLIIFAFLFGLSMDYEVFILSRMREEYDRTGSTEVAVVQGIGRTGRLVTSAALILFLAFTSMASGPETDVKMFATGLAAGILDRRHPDPGPDRARGDLVDG